MDRVILIVIFFFINIEFIYGGGTAASGELDRQVAMIFALLSLFACWKIMFSEKVEESQSQTIEN